MIHCQSTSLKETRVSTPKIALEIRLLLPTIRTNDFARVSENDVNV